jgi:hypothetical protein
MCTIDYQAKTYIPCGIEVPQCVMYQWDIGGDRCENPAVEGSEFCAGHVGVKLCKASGVVYQHEGNRWFTSIDTICHHPVDTFEYRTKRAEFCSDRCRNLWRDTKKSRERGEAITRLKDGKSDPNYMLVKVEGVDRKILLNQRTGRYHWNVIIR